MTLGFLDPRPGPNASTRRGITWGYNPPTEPCSVLVLRTPSAHFVDLRFSEGSPNFDRHFAGKVSYTPIAASESPHFGWSRGMHGSWTHHLDSLGKIDEVFHGDLFVLQDGRDQIEVGTGPHPETGQLDLYKEYWAYPETPMDLYPCVYANHIVDGRLEGMIVRVGRWAQGCRQVGKEVVVVRMELKDGSWVTDPRSSKQASEMIPMSWAVDSVGRDGQERGTWRIVETWKSG